MFIPPCGGAATYQIANSLRLRLNNSAYLRRTPASTGNRTTLTVSAWVKRGMLGATGNEGYILSAGNEVGTGAYQNLIRFDTSDRLDILQTDNDILQWRLTTNAVFRDPSAWYHVVVAIDTTQGTSSNRVKLYVNGTQITSFSTSTYPGASANTQFCSSSYAHNIGRNSAIGFAYSDQLYAEYNIIDGQALAPSSFGQVSGTSSQWVPIQYSGTYGTTGSYLKFNDGSSLTNLGLDRSGNGNNWTLTNCSITAGATYDWMTDTPTNNYPVMSPIDIYVGTPSDGNLKISASNGGFKSNVGGNVGKWYFEIVFTAIGSTAKYVGFGRQSGIGTGVRYANDGTKVVDGTGTAYGATWTTSDVIGVAVDFGGNTITFYKNNTTQGSISYTWSAADYIAVCTSGGTPGTDTFTVNFGQQPFTYTPPSGYVALNTTNLATPAIPNPKLHFEAKTHLGSAVNTGANLLAQFTNFTADFAWGKDRAAANNHQLVDTVRGSTAVLVSNSTAAETTYTAPTSGDNCVAWGWKGGGTAVTNNSGSISSQVSANTTAGFSVVTYTGTGANATVGHGLGVAPSMIIVKGRGTTFDFRVYVAPQGNTGDIQLNLTSAWSASSAVWNNTSPTSTVFSLGTGTAVNQSSATYVAWCFAEVPGFSRISSYTGNGSTDGPFVWCGFKPAYILAKQSSGAGGNWIIVDTVRRTFNVLETYLNPNLNSAETTGTTLFDVTSNGFKLRSTNFNTSSETYIFIAFAESSFKYATAF